MSADKPRLARLTAILIQLQANRLVTARDLAEKHQVSIRTIYRDIKTLEQSGVPIITEEGKGYTMMDGYSLPPVMFTEEEANALLVAEHLILKNKEASLITQYTNAITKIKSVLKSSQRDQIEFLTKRIHVRNNLEEEKTSNYLIQIQSCIANFELVNMSYKSLEDIVTDRIIEPFALYTTQENWILIAFCRKRNDFRSFRLDCIQNIQRLHSYFEPHPMTLQEYMEECKRKTSNAALEVSS